MALATFGADAECRQSLSLPALHEADFRTACLCCTPPKILDRATCATCLSVYCRADHECPCTRALQELSLRLFCPRAPSPFSAPPTPARSYPALSLPLLPRAATPGLPLDPGHPSLPLLPRALPLHPLCPSTPGAATALGRKSAAPSGSLANPIGVDLKVPRQRVGFRGGFLAGLERRRGREPEIRGRVGRGRGPRRRRGFGLDGRRRPRRRLARRRRSRRLARPSTAATTAATTDATTTRPPSRAATPRGPYQTRRSSCRSRPSTAASRRVGPLALVLLQLITARTARSPWATSFWRALRASAPAASRGARPAP